ncbi:hypothetical protein [Pedobacter sp. HMWF019]|uniref:hypothetical protein n=1 Tax=Pedobacter sp. HMWF019 TaxID=2056856 RepID=UPI0011B2A02B|nr:hypothetical protein [Pedobacter sp. HMWF019]
MKIIIRKKRVTRCSFIVGLCSLFLNTNVFAQDSLAISRYDERGLTLWAGTTVVTDATAHGGKAMFRASSTPSATFWYGPYKHIQAGNYLVQVRLKVTSNQSDADFLNFDVVSTNGIVNQGIMLKPSMFRKNNEWQLFTLSVQVPENAEIIEIRGTNFISGITDVYMDYVTIVPGDVRGVYSPDYSIDGKGNVGIGTQDTRGYKLAVSGNMIAESVKVQLRSAWPDYVFTKDYALPSLEETEKHIKEKGHLEGIPSAGEVKNSGIDLGEMNAKLLKKIEELTLQVIELNKTVKQQQLQINTLK